MMDARESSFSDEAEQTEFGVRTGERVQLEYERARRVFRSERRLGHPTGLYLQLDLSVGLNLQLMATLLQVTCQMWLDGLRVKKMFWHVEIHGMGIEPTYIAPAQPI